MFGGDCMPRSDKKTKQEILETATRLFAEKGLENVNVEDVVKRAWRNSRSILSLLQIT